MQEFRVDRSIRRYRESIMESSLLEFDTENELEVNCFFVR